MSIRAFFALVPGTESCLAIERWRTRCWPTLSRPVQARNYHITLSFLGDVQPRQLDAMRATLMSFTAPAIDITMDDTGYWPDSKVLWLGPTDPGAALTTLARQCNQVANRAGIRVRKKSWHAHLTLARNLSSPPPPPLEPPDFKLTCDQLWLLQSVFDKSGVRYLDVERW